MFYSRIHNYNFIVYCLCTDIKAWKYNYQPIFPLLHVVDFLSIIFLIEFDTFEILK